jgi:hypothetical protein
VKRLVEFHELVKAARSDKRFVALLHKGFRENWLNESLHKRAKVSDIVSFGAHQLLNTRLCAYVRVRGTIERVWVRALRMLIGATKTEEKTNVVMIGEESKWSAGREC